jgi:hypothetical protein
MGACIRHLDRDYKHNNLYHYAAQFPTHLSAAAVTKRYQGVSTCTHRVKLGTSDLVEWNKRSLPGTKCEQRFHKTLKERNQCHHTVGSK